MNKQWGIITGPNNLVYSIKGTISTFQDKKVIFEKIHTKPIQLQTNGTVIRKRIGIYKLFGKNMSTYYGFRDQTKDIQTIWFRPQKFDYNDFEKQLIDEGFQFVDDKRKWNPFILSYKNLQD